MFDTCQTQCFDRCQHPSMDNRHDDLTALLIDTIVKIGKERGSTELACILCGNGVPLDVAVRVLTNPAHRRDMTSRPRLRLRE
jgi:hypothetical protein